MKISISEKTENRLRQYVLSQKAKGVTLTINKLVELAINLLLDDLEKGGKYVSFHKLD